MSTTLTLQLDVPREIRFTFPAIEAADALYGINILRPSTYSDMSPKKGAVLVWAGQLHTDKPLSYEQVLTYLPTDTTKYYDMMEVVSRAIKEALGVKPQAANASRRVQRT